MRTIPGTGKLLRKVDKVILTEFVPASSVGIQITENEKKLLPLAPSIQRIGYTNI